jgi:hypothetical protein
MNYVFTVAREGEFCSICEEPLPVAPGDEGSQVLSAVTPLGVVCPQCACEWDDEHHWDDEEVAS